MGPSPRRLSAVLEPDSGLGREAVGPQGVSPKKTKAKAKTKASEPRLTLVGFSASW